MPLQLTLPGIAHSVFGAELPLHKSISGFGDLEDELLQRVKRHLVGLPEKSEKARAQRRTHDYI